MKPKSSLNSEVQEKKYKVNDLTYSKAYDRIKKKKKGIEELNIANSKQDLVVTALSGNKN